MKKHTLKHLDPQKGLHPYSRKAGQLERNLLRVGSIQRRKTTLFSEKHQPKVDRFTWFQCSLEEGVECLSEAEVTEAVLRYIGRLDEEIEALETQRKPGRPRGSKETRLRIARQDDLAAYKSGGGLEIPNLLERANVALLRAWDGDHNSLPRIKSILWREGQR